MEAPFHVKVVEKCHISPPPDSITPPISLPLTFLDIPWLLFPSNQTLFFFSKPPPKSTTTPIIITLLKQSLSLTLHSFHPLAGNLSSPPPPAEPHIVYTNGGGVSLTVAESNTKIVNLSGNHPRPVTNLYSLLPKLPVPAISRDTHVPLLAIQITFFDDLGFSIGLRAQHAAADERTLDQFMKHWASISKSLLKNESFFALKFTPWFDRSVISDPNSLKTTFLKQWWIRVKSPEDSVKETVNSTVFQSTFILNSLQINMIKYQILAKCMKINEDPPLHLSPYVSAISYIWVSLLKIQETLNCDSVYLGFNAGGITRLGYEIPSNYFGNCIAFGRCKAMMSELLGEDGIVFAAKSIGKEIKRLDRDVLGGAEKWICGWDELNVRILGSPKVDSYGIDFGWGQVDKVEKVSDVDNGKVSVISLSGSKDLKGGIEIGVVLTSDKLSEFTSVFYGGLMEIAS